MKKICFITSLVASISFLPSLASAEVKYTYRQPLSGVVASPASSMTEAEQQQHQENIEMCEKETAGGNEFYIPNDSYVNVNMKKGKYGDWNTTITFFWKSAIVSRHNYEQGGFIKNGASAPGLSNTIYAIIPKNKTEDYDWCVSNGYETS